MDDARDDQEVPALAEDAVVEGPARPATALTKGSCVSCEVLRIRRR